SHPLGFLPRGFSSFGLANAIDDHKNVGVTRRLVTHWSRKEWSSTGWHLFYKFTGSVTLTQSCVVESVPTASLKPYFPKILKMSPRIVLITGENLHCELRTYHLLI